MLSNFANSSHYNNILAYSFPSDIFYNHLFEGNIEEYEKHNRNVKVRENLYYFKLIMLYILYGADKYDEKILKIEEKYMQKLNNLILEQFEDIKDALGENNALLFNLKKERDFILKHNDASDEFQKDLVALNKELGYG